MKVIVLTNYAYPQYREKCMAFGADFFFDKSTEFDEAIEVIKAMSAERNPKEASGLVRD